jgi:hypothetical protein
MVVDPDPYSTGFIDLKSGFGSRGKKKKITFYLKKKFKLKIHILIVLTVVHFDGNKSVFRPLKICLPFFSNLTGTVTTRILISEL